MRSGPAGHRQPPTSPGRPDQLDNGLADLPGMGSKRDRPDRRLRAVPPLAPRGNRVGRSAQRCPHPRRRHGLLILDQRPFPPPAWPGFVSTTGFAATQHGLSVPRVPPVGASAPPSGLPAAPSISLSQPCRRHYSRGGGRRSLPGHWKPPPNSGGSAATLPFPRPAQRLLALRPANSLKRPRRSIDISVLLPA